jgi:hypothetical protein
MKSKLKTPAWASVAIASALGFIPLTSQASLMLSGQVRQAGGGATVQFCAADNNGGCTYGVGTPGGLVIQDVDATSRMLQLGGPTPGPVVINGVEVNGSLHRQTVGGMEILDSSSLSVVNTNNFAVEIDVVVGANGYMDNSSISVSGSGTFLLSDGSTLVNEWWFRPGTSQPGADPFDTARPGTLLHSFTTTAAGTAYSYSDSKADIAALVAGTYGLEEVFRFTLAANGGSLTSRGQVAIGIEEVPEPASLALVGLGGLAIAFVRRQKAHEA